MFPKCIFLELFPFPPPAIPSQPAFPRQQWPSQIAPNSRIPIHGDFYTKYLFHLACTATEENDHFSNVVKRKLSQVN